MLDFSKWAVHLPIQMQVDLIKSRYFDFNGVKNFGETITFVKQKQYSKKKTAPEEVAFDMSNKNFLRKNQ